MRQKILITGAGSGIGRELALKLIHQGITPAVNVRAVRAEDGSIGQVFAGDLTHAGVAESVVKSAADWLGGLDAVIHCAGVGLLKPATETTDAEFTRVMNTNVRATFLVAKEACRIMSEARQGLFVTIPGILGRAPMRNASAYCASKYAVTGMLKCFAQEYQRNGIRFSLFHLGGVDTPFWDDLGMAVPRDRMIPVTTAADLILQALDAPPHLVLSEVVLQPQSHQLV